MHPLLRYYRQVKGLSQARLARLAGVSQPTVSAVERGDYIPTEAQLNAIAAVLDVSPAFRLLQPVADDEQVLA